MNIVAVTGDTREGLFIMADQTTGAVVRTYDSDPETGFVVMRQNAQRIVMMMTGSRVEFKSRVCTLSGPVASLKALCDNWNRKGSIPGAIVTKELLYSQLPQSFKDRKDLDEQYAKRAGEDGVILTKDGEKIYQFRSYVEDASLAVDTRIQHDNVDEVAAQNAAKRAAVASLDA